MVTRMRSLMMVIALFVVGLVGWRGYYYFCDMQQPQIILQGLSANASCCGDVACLVNVDKSGELTVALDGKPLVKKFRMKARQEGHAFTIPTRTLSDGEHRLTISFVDSTYHRNAAELHNNFAVDNMPLQAALIKANSPTKVLQGRTLHLQIQTNKPIRSAIAHVLSHSYPCFPESKNALVYECFVPIACEENASEYLMAFDIEDAVGNKIHLDDKFQVVMYPFKSSVLRVSDEKVKKEQELGEDQKKFEAVVAQLTKDSPPEKLWRGTFCTPIDILRVTTEFGTIRTSQHKGRYAHKALDVVNHPKSVIWSTQEGKVVLKDRFAGSGNTVVVDHGWGILSMFFHLDDFAPGLQVGQKVAKGDPLGTQGMSGFASGSHLHWEMRVGNVPVDPMQWTKSTF